MKASAAKKTRSPQREWQPARHLTPPLNAGPRCDVPSLRSPVPAAPVTRLFTPAQLDLDDLAEAIRSLLGPGSPPQICQSSPPKPELLSFPHQRDSCGGGD
jgi:hypothetical protein